jgi:hypothetical protein
VQHSQCEEQSSNFCFYVYYRLHLVGHHARWLASPALLRFRCICSGAPALETGEVLAVLACSLFSASANVISVREGVIWLLLATLAELPQVVHLACFLTQFFSL